MKVLCCLVALFSISAFGEDQESEKPASYSYFSIGTERINYQETISLGNANIKTDTTANNLVLLSGGRNFISNSLSFSINAMSTLYPNRVTEDWRLTNSVDIPADSDGDGIADTNLTFSPQTLQSNSFTYSQASTQVLMHYHPQLWWSFDAGLSYSLGTVKRSSFNYNSALACDSSKRDCSGDNVVEEIFGELSIMTGASILLPLSHKLRMRLSFAAGLPLVSRIENTLYPDLSFDSIEGWNSQVTSALMYQFNENISLGLAYDFQYQFKARQGKTVSTTQQVVYIPENVRIAQRVGAVASWVF